MSLAKWSYRAVWGCIALSAGLIFYGIVKSSIPPSKSGVPAPPPTYPYVDQFKMCITLRNDERFVSICPVGVLGSFELTTSVVPSHPNQPRKLRVYRGLMGDKGTSIYQPQLWYEIQEQ